MTALRSLVFACAATGLLAPASFASTPVEAVIQYAWANAQQSHLQDDPAPEADGPVTGMPPLDQMLIGRMDVWLNPTYWSTWVYEALVNGNIQIPSPTDIVRPEIWTPNVTVANDPEYISPLPEAAQDLALLSYQWDGAQKTIQDFLHTTETDGLVFVANGAMVDELYNNGYSAEVRHQPWSVTKTFIAATVGIAFEEGLIRNLQEPIDAYIPDLVGTAWEGVTIENILQMESGVHWDEDTPVLAQNTQVEQWIQVALDYYTEGALGQTRNEFLMALPKVYEQGTEFRYNSGNTQVLSWMLEILYGKPYNEIIAEKIWQPMGAWGDARMIADREGGVISSQGLYSRPRDLARFGELLRNGGVNSDGRRVVPAAWIEKMTTMTEVSEGRYGYQTWSSAPVAEGAYRASGFQGNKITVVPGACLTAVRTSHSFGLDYRDGDDPFDPNAYGFATNFSADEWQAVVRAVMAEIGCGAGAASSTTGGAASTRTGGSLSLWLLLVLGLIGLRRDRRAAPV